MSLPTLVLPEDPDVFSLTPVSLLSIGKGGMGYDEYQAMSLRDPYRAILGWGYAERDSRDYVLSFFSQFEGGGGPFWWIPIGNEGIPTPSGFAPTLSQVAGGALSERTYYVVITWYDSVYGETKQSGRASLTVLANYYLKVAIPVMPLPITSWRLYAHETSGSECLQATIDNDLEWTQSAALSTGTATPPSANNLYPKRKWMAEEKPRVKRAGPDGWEMGMQLIEQSI